MQFDGTDSQIVAALQQDGTLTTEALGEQLGLSASQAGRRKARLEKLGVITEYVAKVDANALGIGVQAFVQVQMATHNPDLVREFTRIVEIEPRVTAAFTMTGDADYLLRVSCSDLSDLNDLIHERILPLSAVARVQSQIVMSQLKADSPLPI